MPRSAMALKAGLDLHFKKDDSHLAESSTAMKILPLHLFTGLFKTFLLVWLFIIILFLFLYQQLCSSARRIPSGTRTSMEMEILWNYLRNLSHYMLRVDWGRWQRETLTYWEMSKADFQRWTQISIQSFTSLSLITISVSFIVSICTWHV